jgi:benzoyl-CoA reductase/2-hydroxyglutaryl-CoA dehydratase subunit BcrC/BadD/HgdB
VYAARSIHARPGVLIGVSSNTVPWELLRATGFEPILLSPLRRETPLADRYVEPVFSSRIKSIFDFLISPEAGALSAVVIPRTSEQEHKLYLYLREVSRQGTAPAPQPILYNLLHARSSEARAYGLERTRDLKLQLESLAEREITTDALAAAIAEGNAARQVIRQLLELRDGSSPKLCGTEALALIGAWYFMDRSEYTRLAREAVAEIVTRPPLNGPRILIKSPPLDHLEFHAAIEAYGAVVVAEDDWWGSRAAGDDIAMNADPICAIFEKYYLDTVSPRVFPSDAADAWFSQRATEVDGVVFYLPEEDDVIGWDYPRLRRFLEQRDIPSFLLRAASPDSGIKPFIQSLRHG